MKKNIILLPLLFLLTIVVSCQKDPSGNGNSSEGLFQPQKRIESLTGGINQTWNWGTSKLASIHDNSSNVDYSFNYTGDLLGNVNISGNGVSQTMHFTYGGSLLSQMDLSENNKTQYTRNILHDANDNMTGYTLIPSDEYLAKIAMENTLGSFGNLPDFEVTNKQFDVTYNWTGDNITQETIKGNVSIIMSLSEVAGIFGIPSYILSALGLEGEYPISVTVNATTNYTYDQNINPFYCFYGLGMEVKNLSKNNIIRAERTGGAKAEITLDVPVLGTITYPYNIKLDKTDTYSYNYDKKGFPTSFTHNGEPTQINYSK